MNHLPKKFLQVAQRNLSNELKKHSLPFQQPKISIIRSIVIVDYRAGICSFNTNKCNVARFDMFNTVEGEFYKKTHARCIFAFTVA